MADPLHIQYVESNVTKQNQAVFDSQRTSSGTSKPPCAALIRSASSPSFEVFDDDIERRSFAFFLERTVDEIVGCFPDKFWAKLIPLSAHHEPALKHAVIALAALHERFEQGDRSILKSNSDIVDGGFALDQYLKAIKHILRPVRGKEKPPLDTSLVACVLFACFESLRGHHGSALSHIHSGVRILSQANEHDLQSNQEIDSPELCIPRESLDIVFARLDAQEVQLLGSRPMQLPPPRRNTAPGFHSHTPAVFTSLDEARNNLDYQWNVCQQKGVDFEYRDLFIQGIEEQEHRDAYDRNRILYKSILGQWNKAFQAYLDNRAATMDSKALRGAMLLKINARVLSMHLEMPAFSLLHFQTTWDDILPIFEEIVDLASTVLDAQADTDKKLARKPVFQLDQSIIGPLFSVAHKCRDPGIRRKAISLLYSAPRQEGVWDSILTARVAERIMNLEEKGLGEVKTCADVPDSARISDIQVSFDLSARRGYINYLRLRSLDSKVREPITDVLEW
ncbi:MAG: hypothetical protein Q9222_004353 [Ikaeria aurantiellina]